MDDRGFDQIVQALGAGLPRRGVLAMLAGLPLGLAARSSPDDAASRDGEPSDRPGHPGASAIFARKRRRGPHADRKGKGKDSCRNDSPAGQCCAADGTCSGDLAAASASFSAAGRSKTRRVAAIMASTCGSLNPLCPTGMAT